jgi:hypothetical protein
MNRSARFTRRTSLGFGSMKCGLNRGEATASTFTCSPPMVDAKSANDDSVATTFNGSSARAAIAALSISAAAAAPDVNRFIENSFKLLSHLLVTCHL